jgi:aspartate ammonia-lyase
VVGITANPEKMLAQVHQSLGLITALVPAIGYEAAEAVAREAATTGRGVYDLVLERGILGKEQLEALLRPESMLGEDR